MDERRKCYVKVVATNATNDMNKDDAKKASDFFKFEPEGNIRLQRPKTTLTKKYRADGVFDSSSDIGEVYKQVISPHVSLAVKEGYDILLWTYGTRKTGKSATVFGRQEELGSASGSFMDGISLDLSKLCFDSMPCRQPEDPQRVVVELSYLGVAGDTDKAFDCLLLPSTEKQRTLRMRESSNSHFYMDGLTNVVVKSITDIDTVIKTGAETVARLKVEAEVTRLHRLVTFTIWKLFDSGDCMKSCIQVMDICGADRATSSMRGRGLVTAGPRAAPSANLPKGTRKGGATSKEDKTLKAISRVSDALSQRKSHVPYRDSKLTRLVSNTMGGGGRHCNHNLAFVFVSEQEEMFDETSAMLEFVTKIRKISPTTEEKEHVCVRHNRMRELEETKRQAETLGENLGMDPNSLSSSDLKLDMSSSMELVEFRDILSKLEALSIDPLDALIERSEAWWSERQQ